MSYYCTKQFSWKSIWSMKCIRITIWLLWNSYRTTLKVVEHGDPEALCIAIDTQMQRHGPLRGRLQCPFTRLRQCRVRNLNTGQLVNWSTTQGNLPCSPVLLFYTTIHTYLLLHSVSLCSDRTCVTLLYRFSTTSFSIYHRYVKCYVFLGAFNIPQRIITLIAVGFGHKYLKTKWGIL